MRFLLTSAGLKNDRITEALLDLVGKPASEISVVFVPTAANLDAGDKSWLIDNLCEFREKNFKTVDFVDISSVPLENWKARFAVADVLCFGGGNEQYLSKVFTDVGMKDFLVKILKEKVYVGISAGSMVAGNFIDPELMKIVYPEEINEPLGKPLGLVNLCFIPHLNSQWFAHVRKGALENLKPQFDSSVYATDDETALAVRDEVVNVVGGGDAWIFEK